MWLWLFFFFWQHHLACGILVTRPGMDPMLPVMEAQRPPWNNPCGSILKTYLEYTTSHHLQHYQLVQDIVILTWVVQKPSWSPCCYPCLLITFSQYSIQSIPFYFFFILNFYFVLGYR